MDDIIKQYHTVSLGSNCLIKRYLDHYLGKRETHLFDWLGTSMWGICMMTQDDFSGVVDVAQYSERTVLKGDAEMPVHKQYYIRLKHDTLDTFSEKYTRRIERFRSMLQMENNILFIRLEESMGGRIIYPEYKEHYHYNELHYCKRFCATIHEQYPNLRFKVLLISRRLPCTQIHTGAYSIIVIRAYSPVTHWEACIPQLDKVFKTNLDYITKTLRPNSLISP